MMITTEPLPVVAPKAVTITASTMSTTNNSTTTTTSPTTNHDEMKLYEEIKGFLVSNRSDLRLAATGAILQQVQHGCYSIVSTATAGTIPPTATATATATATNTNTNTNTNNTATSTTSTAITTMTTTKNTTKFDTSTCNKEDVVQENTESSNDTNVLEKIVRFGFVPIVAKNASYSPLDDNDNDDVDVDGNNKDNNNNNNNHNDLLDMIVSVQSLKILVLLSSNGICADQVVHELITDARGINRMIEIVLSPSITISNNNNNNNNNNCSSSHNNNNNQQQHPKTKTQKEILWRQRVNYAMSLLANMSRLEIGAVAITGFTMEEKPILISNCNTNSSSSSTTTTNNDVSSANSNSETSNDDKVVVAASTSTDTPTPTPAPVRVIEKLPPKPSLELILARYMNPLLILPPPTPTYYDDILLSESNGSETFTAGSTNPQEQQNNTLTSSSSSSSSNNSIVIDSNSNDPYQHFSAVLMNITQIEQGREFVLRIHRKHKKKQSTTTTATDTNDVDTDDNNNNNNKKDDKDDNDEWTVLQTVLNQLRSPNPIRRRGIAGTIRNCVLDRDYSFWFLHIVQITKYILYPLAGPEELDYDEKQGLYPDLWLEGPDKKRELDHLTRLYLVEAILYLCKGGRKAREQLRLERVYVILKWADMVEVHDDVTEMIYECVNYLRADEPGTAEGSSDLFVKDAYTNNTNNNNKNKQSSTSTGDVAAAAVVATEQSIQNFDDVD